MLHSVRSNVALLAVVALTALAGCVAAQPPAPPPVRVAAAPPAAHPAYLHAMSDLRSARWLIEHRPGDWAQTADEAESIRQIDAAIGDIRKAAFDDGKNANDRPPVDDHPGNRGRIHEALQFLRKARADIAGEEDNGFAGGLRDRAIGHIDAAIGAARRVFHE
jgi:hypothetical protein